MKHTAIFLPALVFIPILGAQDTPAADVKQTYAKLCSGCHGDDLRGTQQGPGLAGNPWVRRRSPRSLRTVIQNGIPAAGMPAFKLPESTLDALVEMIVAANASASKSNVPGNSEAGKAFFFGKGQCSSCHMVQGQGAVVGPDLTTVGLDMTVDEIREALVQPAKRIAAGYDLVTVRLRDGKTLRGFARNRTNFDIAVQDLKGVIHPLSMDHVSGITDEKRSHMPALKAAPDELQNLIAYLSRMSGLPVGPLTGVRGNTAVQDFDFQRILNPKPGEWLSYNGTLSGNRYSDLKHITTANVERLALKWSYSIPLWSQFFPDTPYYRENMRYYGLETVPIVADGVMYITGPNQASALDPRTGSEIWRYARPRTPGLVSDASLGTNRGAAILGDKIFMVTDNAHLIALNRVTGKLVWEVVMWDEPQKYGGTVTPLVVKDMVIAGVSGGDWGIRGFLSAYKASTGERVWRHWTIPAEGDPGFETWKGSAVKLGGGATWLTGSYDPSLNTLYWATGNPWPNSDDRERAGDNLYTDSVLALYADTGKMKWYYQFTPHDLRDWDANEPNVLVDAKFRGRDRKLLLHADRNGFFYVFDRTDGKLLLAEKFIRRLTWASGIGPDGRPIRLQETDVRCPDHATNWHATTFSPTTGLYYVMATERCVVRASPGGWKNERPPEDPGTKYLRAIDIQTGKIVWETAQTGPTDGKRVAGVLGTAGGLLFYGDASGYFVAADERNGKTLWRAPLNATVKTSPMTFAIDGEQYVALAVGSNIMCFGLTR